MKHPTIKQIEDILQCSITNEQIIGGGCIAQTSLLKTDDGRNYFLKQGYDGCMFRKEANGLIELKKAAAIRVPEVILVTDNFLLLEAIISGNKKSDFFETFGALLANLHKHTHTAFGFCEDNFIGSTPQINTECNSWVEFYFTHRLLYQYRLAEKNGYTDDAFKKAFQYIENSLPRILGETTEAPSLLHGDLWAGNYMVSSNGHPVLIDPAVYYGHREADLAMTKLFGGFTSEFYTSYHHHYPLQDGYENRQNIYMLYHVLNHLNLFGSAYKAHAMQLMNSYR
ncbi:fructosamine kinase family protein [Carboxylicivirga taeanensis]|uniref:fructosamine kinase family protein n=1 Tax=Carboxylicivirga taeanensis TaxID=1416875 RepID=UPI003F6DCF48